MKYGPSGWYQPLPEEEEAERRKERRREEAEARRYDLVRRYGRCECRSTEHGPDGCKKPIGPSDAAACEECYTLFINSGPSESETLDEWERSS